MGSPGARRVTTARREDGAHDAAQPAGGLAPAALFDSLQEVENLGGADLGDGAVREGLCKVFEEPPVFRHRRGGRAIGFQILEKLLDDEAEGVARGGLGRDAV